MKRTRILPHPVDGEIRKMRCGSIGAVLNLENVKSKSNDQSNEN